MLPNAPTGPASLFSPDKIGPWIVLIIFTSLAWWICKKFDINPYYSAIVFFLGIFSPFFGLVTVFILLTIGLVKKFKNKNKS